MMSYAERAGQHHVGPDEVPGGTPATRLTQQ